MTQAVASGENEKRTLNDMLGRLRELAKTDAPLGDALQLAEDVVASAAASMSAADNTLVGEVKSLADHIARTRHEIAAFQPNEIRDSHIPEAGAELEAVVKHTEEATSEIMSAAEAIMSADPQDAGYAELVQDGVMKIFEACSFQDITGQRISKIIKTLTYIETRLDRLVSVVGISDAGGLTDTEQAEQERAEKNILNGPQLVEKAQTQDEIDALFGDD